MIFLLLLSWIFGIRFLEKEAGQLTKKQQFNSWATAHIRLVAQAHNMPEELLRPHFFSACYSHEKACGSKPNVAIYNQNP